MLCFQSAFALTCANIENTHLIPEPLRQNMSGYIHIELKEDCKIHILFEVCNHAVWLVSPKWLKPIWFCRVRINLG